MTEGITVLFLAADPRDVGYRPLLDEELNQIRKKIQAAKFRDAFRLESELSVKPSDLQEYFSNHDPDIVHFSGHGNSKGIILQNNFGRRTVISKSALASFFKLNKGKIRIVLLNACYSEVQAKALSETIDFTIGMGGQVTDKAAIAFAASFYQSLANGKSVHEAFESGKVQLKLLKIGKSKLPELLVRKGADVFAPFLPRLSPQASIPTGIAPPFPASVFTGRETEIDHVKRLLGITGSAGLENKVTIICGYPGVGKTAIVGAIGHDPDTAKTYSDGVLWASLKRKPDGGGPDLLSEMAKWGHALGTDKLMSTPTLAECSSRLSYLLQDKRMLLILDDVWEADHAAHFLKAAGSKCAVLITTRESTEVADYFASTPKSIYKLPILTEDNAIELLRAISPSAVDQYPDECRRLVRSLECLPLALRVAGRLINSEQNKGLSVPNLLRSIEDGTAIIAAKAPEDRLEGDTIPTVEALLNRSTDLLSKDARECFASLGPFAPKPATFDLEALKSIWKVKDPAPVVRSLVGHGLMEYIGAGRYQMHALLVAHTYSFLEYERLFSESG